MSARRNLTTGQKAMMAADFLPDLEAEAKARQCAHGGTAPGRSSQQSAPIGTKCSTAPKTGRAAAHAANLIGTSTRSVQRAKRVQNSDPIWSNRLSS